MSELEEVLRLRAALTAAGWRPYDKVHDVAYRGPRREELTMIARGAVDYERLQVWVKDEEAV